MAFMGVLMVFLFMLAVFFGGLLCLAAGLVLAAVCGVKKLRGKPLKKSLLTTTAILNAIGFCVLALLLLSWFLSG